MNVVVIMKDWLFSESDFICDLRVAGVLVRNGMLLVQRDRDGNAFALPGGHVGIGEVMTDCLIREFIEEIGAEIFCKNLLWTEECFWSHKGKKIHTIAFYYRIELKSDSDILNLEDFVSQKDNGDVLIGWVALDCLGQLTIYPEFIKDRIDQLDAPCAHFVTCE